MYKNGKDKTPNGSSYSPDVGQDFSEFVLQKSRLYTVLFGSQSVLSISQSASPILKTCDRRNLNKSSWVDPETFSLLPAKDMRLTIKRLTPGIYVMDNSVNDILY